MRRFNADFHIHTDDGHGDTPENAAVAIVESDLDVFATTDHASGLLRNEKPVERFLDVKNAIVKLTEGSKRKILALFGFEARIIFGNISHHVGYIYEQLVNSDRDAPPVLPNGSSWQDLESLKRDCPGVAILYHPALRLVDGVHRRRRNLRAAAIQELMKSGLVDGVEVFNGTILSNGASNEVTLIGMEMFQEAKACKKNLAPVAFSDAHEAGMIGQVATRFMGRKPEDVFKAIRCGSTTPLLISDGVIEKVHAIFERK